MQAVQAIGSALIVAAFLAGAGPAAAAEGDDGLAAPPTAAAAAERVGRYTMVPAEGGFVRLDTETGTISQCRRSTAAADAGWRCAVIPEAVLGEPDRAEALAARIDALESEVARLKARLDEPASPAASTGDADVDRALDFSEEVMHRFFDMMREMKSGGDDPGKDPVRP